MKTLRKEIQVTIANVDEFGDHIPGLLAAAVEARANAYAPYSRHTVGAAVLSDDAVFTGCNIEKCTLSETTHAEENAINAMICSKGPDSTISCVVVAGGPDDVEITILPQLVGPPITDLNDLVFSCGRCRQIIWEHVMNENVQVFCLMSNGQIGFTTIGDLFPMPFGPKELTCPL